jgi:hypothetical protein
VSLLELIVSFFFWRRDSRQAFFVRPRQDVYTARREKFFSFKLSTTMQFLFMKKPGLFLKFVTEEKISVFEEKKESARDGEWSGGWMEIDRNFKDRFDSCQKSACF